MKSPLADRIRPQSLEDFVGQKHLIAQGKPLRNIIDSSNEIPNMIFYGSVLLLQVCIYYFGQLQRVMSCLV